MRAFSLVVASGDYSLAAVRRLLAVASLSRDSQAPGHRLGGPGARAHLLHGVRDLPATAVCGPLPWQADGFFTSEPPGKAGNLHFDLGRR